MHKVRNRDEDWHFKTDHDAALAGLSAPRGHSGRQRREEGRAAAALLSEVIVLRALRPEVLAELGGFVWEMEYPAGRVLFSRGSRADNGLIVLRGSVIERVVGVQVAEHREQSLLNVALTPGVHFAPTTMVAGLELRAVVIDRAGLLAAVARRPELGHALVAPATDGSVEPPPRPTAAEALPRPRTAGSPGLIAAKD